MKCDLLYSKKNKEEYHKNNLKETDLFGLGSELPRGGISVTWIWGGSMWILGKVNEGKFGCRDRLVTKHWILWSG